MTPALRKYHRHVWFLMAGFLPVLFIAAIVVLPEKRPDPYFQNHQPAALPQLLKTVEAGGLTLQLRAGAGTAERQLEIVLKQPLQVPAALVYWSPTKITQPDENSRILGSLGPQGIYRFALGPTSPAEAGSYLLIFDPIKNSAVEALQL